MWCIELVPCFPCQVSLKGLFPIKDVIKLRRIASIWYKMAITKHKICRNDRGFIRLLKRTFIIIDCAPTMNRHSISKFVPSHCSFSNFNYGHTEAILRVLYCKTSWIYCDYRILARVTTVDHLNQLGIPVLN